MTDTSTPLVPGGRRPPRTTAAAKGLAADSPWIGEELATGPMPVARQLQLLVGSLEQGTDHLAADRPRAEDPDAQSGAAHHLGWSGRDIRRMVADPSERPPGRRRGQHLVGYTPER